MIKRLCLALTLCLLALGLPAQFQPYWERPQTLGQGDLRFVQAYQSGEGFWLLYQRIEANDEAGGRIALVGRIFGADGQAGDEFTIVPALPYEGGQAPLLYAAAVNPQGRLFVVYGADAQTLVLLGSQGGAGPLPAQPAFSEIGRLVSASTLVAPRLFLKAGGGFVILATQNLIGSQGAGEVVTATSQNSVFSQSADGQSWSPPLMIDATLSGNINSSPAWAEAGGREYIYFHSLNYGVQVGGKSYEQLYFCLSEDAGQSWSEPALFSNFPTPGDRANNPAAVHANQRPLLLSQGGKLQLIWERRLKTDAPQLWRAALGADGRIEGQPEKLSDTAGGAVGAQWRSSGGQEYLSWFTASSRGSRAWLAWREGKSWQSREMSAGRSSTVLYPVFGFSRGRLHYFYYDRKDNDVPQSALVYVQPDLSARPPILVGANFENRQTGRQAELRFRLVPDNDPVPDASGLAAYSWVLSDDPQAPVPAKALLDATQNPDPVALPDDGTWYLRARAQDKAGNWSGIATISYTRDTTPPEPVSLAPLPVDEKGWLVSNDFDLGFAAADPADAAEYGYSLQFLGEIGIAEAYARLASLGELPELGRLKTPRVQRRNVQNGVWVFAAWAYDRVGNRSAARVVPLYTNKYLPRTAVNYVTVNQDLLGERYLSIQGEGFTQSGTIVRLVLDRDGVAPWDFVFLRSQGQYQVESDRRISQLRLDRNLSGRYLLGVEHAERGLEFAAKRLEFVEHGVIKFGDYSLASDISYRLGTPAAFRLDGGSLILGLAMAFLALIIVFSLRAIRSVMRDAVLLEETALALADNRLTPVAEAARKVQSMQRQRIGLRIKFTIFFLSLVLAVVLIISLPLSSYTLERQKTVLVQGLYDRLNVLMESLQSASTIYFKDPENYSNEFDQLTRQGAIMPEVSYITITGQGKPSIGPDGETPSKDFDIVWASSDSALREQGQAAVAPGSPVGSLTERHRTSYLVDGKQVDTWLESRSGIADSLSPLLPEFQAQFDQRFREGLGSITAELAALNAELASLAKNNTPDGLRRRAEIGTIQQGLRNQLNQKSRELAGGMLALPGFDPARYDQAQSDYIFYRPVYFSLARETDPASARFYRGMVRVGVNTAPINASIASTQAEILTRILLFALLALGGGLVGAIILSSIIVGPIRRLVRGVEEIREIITLDVEAQERRFGDFIKAGTIKLKSHDELATLGGRIGDMVDGLWHAATANKDLVAGSDIQRKFMPLDKVGDVLGTTGGAETERTEIFGYYEGAKGVSGDFLNFQQIIPGLWACIKCDISGKGIPAALIMVEVATVFLSYFTEWERKAAERKKLAGGKAAGNDGILVPLVTTINDLINEREFKGRFAAFDIVLYEEKSGDCIFCHAGDQTVYILRDRTRAVETIMLQSTPAAGMFSSKDEFPPFFRCREERNVLEVGDYLMFFTDGIDESRRQFRNPDFSEYLATAEDVAAGRVPDEDHGSIAKQVEGPDGSQRNFLEAEQFTWDRMIAVAEAVRRRGSYRLVKHFNPLPDEVLDFDFSDLEPTGRNIVIALAAVEKVFRLIPDPRAGAEDRILVDRVVDDFLKRHFKGYATSFRHRREGSTNKLYQEYTHLKEEPQYDDLAFLIIRRK